MVGPMLKYMQGVVQANPRVFPQGMRSAYLMIDRAPWHMRAVKMGLLEELGMQPHQLLPHPPNSPDFQAPIEWGHALLVRKVQAALAQDGQLRTADAVKKVLQATWEGKGRGARKNPLLTPEVITEMFKKLEHIMHDVIEQGGGWGKKGN
jgi:uncharacterized protein YqcC (DUF446 family)